MPGLVPGIHVLLTCAKQDVDGRAKPGHDEIYRKCAISIATFEADLRFVPPAEFRYEGGRKTRKSHQGPANGISATSLHRGSRILQASAGRKFWRHLGRRVQLQRQHLRPPSRADAADGI